MKKTILSLFFAIAMTFTILPNRADAVVSAPSVVSNFGIFSYYFFATGGAFVYIGVSELIDADSCYNFCDWDSFIYSWGALLGGIILLDKAGHAELQEFSKSEASEIGLTEEERQSLNNDLEEVNAVMAIPAKEFAKDNPGVSIDRMLTSNFAEPTVNALRKLREKIQVAE